MVRNLIGEQLGDYKIVEKIASGGMSQIYRGVDERLGRIAAIKVLPPEIMETDDLMVERFQREARAVASLEHPNIVPIYQYGEKDDLYFLAMKHIGGEDLADVLNRMQREDELIDPKRMLTILSQVADALDHAHSAGVVHRDVKPSNIMLEQTANGDEKAILTDFGLVLRQQVDQTMGTAFGTPRYISPEQALASEDSVPQSDIYSLAVIVYEMLTGSMVFKADTAMQIAISHISVPPPPPTSINPQIPKDVEREILKALSKQPEKRHESAGAFVRALKIAFGDLDKPQTSTVPKPLNEATIPLSQEAREKLQASREQMLQNVSDENEPTIVFDEDESRPRAKMSEQASIKAADNAKLDSAPDTELKPEPIKAASPPPTKGGEFDKTVPYPPPITKTAEATETTEAENEKTKTEPKPKHPAIPAALPASASSATPTTTAPQKSGGSPLRFIIPVILLLVVAGGAFALLGDGGAEDTNTNTPETAAVAGDSTDNDESTESSENTTSRDVALVSVTEGQPISVLYDFDGFALRNDGVTDLPVGDLVITDADGSETLFDGSRIINEMIPMGACVVISAQTNDIPDAWNCDNLHSPILLQSSAFFWRETNNADGFVIFAEAGALADCSTVTRGTANNCDVLWPFVVDGE